MYLNNDYIILMNINVLYSKESLYYIIIIISTLITNSIISVLVVETINCKCK